MGDPIRARRFRAVRIECAGQTFMLSGEVFEDSAGDMDALLFAIAYRDGFSEWHTVPESWLNSRPGEGPDTLRMILARLVCEASV